ncbi:hypothetical protein F5141DRAFT_1068457 [Pisolithus sp. B1]|nr:hypothetical protein F5141DRAFT_1068457 [Pisolithus sp. B1]
MNRKATEDEPINKDGEYNANGPTFNVRTRLKGACLAVPVIWIAMGITEWWVLRDQEKPMLCESRAADGVRLVTTMWDKVRSVELAECRVSQLEADFRQPLIEAGARHRRFKENSSRCTWEIIQDLTGEGVTLLLQEELVDKATELNETTVGQILYKPF